MRKPGIRTRLLGTALLLIFGATLTLNIVGVHVTRTFMHKRFNDRISFLARYLALNSEVGVLIGDTSGLNVLALNLLGEEDVAKVSIFDNKDRQLVVQERDVRGPLSTVETPVVFQRQRGENLLFRQIPTPIGRIDNKGREFIGRVQITYSTHGIEQLIREMAFKYSWFSIALAFLAGCTFFFISRRIVVEVKDLASTVRRVGEGDLNLRVAPGKMPETRSLALDFNAMLDSLQQSRIALDKANEDMIKQTALAEVGKFSLMIAHEVKNPLSIIKSSMDILKRDPGQDQRDIMIDYIEDEIKRLNRLIEDFLRFARPTKPNPRSVELNAMLTSVVERFQLRYFQSTLEFKLDIPETPAWAVADRDLLMQSLDNVINNACDASEYDGLIEIHARCNAGTWTVEIADNANGIETEPISLIFEPFFTTRSKGTGLGLAFVFQAVKSHQGEIWAENRKEGGALFTVEIPLYTNGRSGADQNPVRKTSEGENGIHSSC